MYAKIDQCTDYVNPRNEASLRGLTTESKLLRQRLIEYNDEGRYCTYDSNCMECRNSSSIYS